MSLQDAIDSLDALGRLMAAAGAVGVPGGALTAALQAARGGTDLGRLRTDGSLGLLGIERSLSPGDAEDVLFALGAPAERPLAWLEALAPGEVTLAVDVAREGYVSVEIEAAIDGPVDLALTALRRAGGPTDGLLGALADLALPRAVGIGCGPRGSAVKLAQALTPGALSTQAGRLASTAERVASRAQARWLAAMHEALSPGRSSAPVTLWCDDHGAIELEVAYEATLPETALRVLHGLYPDPRSGAVLGALSAAARADHVCLVAGVRRSEPPAVRLVFG